jgi:hypothetical protein
VNELLASLPQDFWFYGVGLPTIFMMAASKVAFGGGLAIMGVPLLALVVDPITAAIIIAPLVSVMDIFTFRAFPPSTWSAPDLRWLLPGLVVGIVLGALMFTLVDARLVGLVIAVVTLAFSARWFMGGARSKTIYPVRPALAVGCAVVGGFTTFVAHAGGPPIAMYLIGRGLDKRTYVGTTAAVFTIGNVVKLFPYFGMVLATGRGDVMLAALALAPAIPFGAAFGRAVHDALDEKRLYFWTYVFLVIAGTKMLFDAVRSLL